LVVTDDNAAGQGGAITLEASCAVNMSGGDGAVGGNARRDATIEANTDPSITAVVLDADSVFLPMDGGVVKNLGHIIAKGGANGGAGGDVMFHGRGDTTSNPVEGSQDRAGQGGGPPGDFFTD